MVSTFYATLEHIFLLLGTISNAHNVCLHVSIYVRVYIINTNFTNCIGLLSSLITQ